MRDAMNGKGPTLTKSFPTLTAFEWLFFRVNVPGEGFSTLIINHTQVWESSPMISQMVLSSEGFVTNVTSVWSLISVSPLVDEQVV